MHHANIAEKKTRASRRKYKMEGRGKKEGKENKTRREKILHVTLVFSGGRAEREREDMWKLWE